MNHYTASNPREMQTILGRIANMPPESYPVEVRVGKPKKRRSLSQNAISHAWYATVSSVEKEYTAAEVKCFCKYTFGIPILREKPEFSEMIEKILGPLSYEERVRAMEFINVSSVMNKAQMIRYLEDIQNFYRGRVPLEFPNEHKEAA